MSGKIANLNKPKTQRAKTKRRGRKRVAPLSKSRKTPPGRGATRLRSSVNSLVSQQADEIAKALIDKTKAGNMTGARILVELSGAGKPPDPVKKKHGGLKLIDLLESDSEWDFDTDPDTPHPGCEWNGERWVRPEPKTPNPDTAS
jgi:hypothetical protein